MFGSWVPQRFHCVIPDEAGIHCCDEAWVVAGCGSDLRNSLEVAGLGGEANYRRSRSSVFCHTPHAGASGIRDVYGGLPDYGFNPSGVRVWKRGRLVGLAGWRARGV